MTTMDNGIQNHTSATAAPVIIDAVGTTRRGHHTDMPDGNGGGCGCDARGYCDHAFNLWICAAAQHGVFLQPWRG